MHPRTLPRPPPAVSVGLLCLGLVVLASAVLRHESGVGADGRFYERMALHPSGPHNFPYAFRIGVPWIVNALPIAPVAGFTVLAWLALACAGGSMYALLREFEIGARFATALAAGFVLAPPMLVALLRHGRSVDPETALIIILGTLLIVRRQRLALALTLLAGATNHESCLFLIPLAYAVWARRPFDPTALRDLAAVALAPLALYALIRTQIATAGRQYIPGYAGPFLAARWDIVRQGLSSGNWGPELRRVAVSFGPLWLLAPFGLRTRSMAALHRRRAEFARRGLTLVALCLIAMTFAFDWGRVSFFFAPVVYVTAASVVDRPGARRRRLALATVIALLAVDAGYAGYMQVYGVRHGLDAAPGIAAVPVY